MRRQVKGLLRLALQTPPPERKRAFLREHPRKADGGWNVFLLSQLGSIRKRVWCLDAAALILALLGGNAIRRDILWTTSAMLPLLAAAVVSEGGRSQRFGMAELEQSSRFSLKSVVLARLWLVGGVNALVFLAVTGLLSQHLASGFLPTGIYILCPYLLTDCLALYVSRRFRGREGDYLCLAVGILVSAGVYFGCGTNPWVYAPVYFPKWVLASLALAAFAAWESGNYLKKMEGFLWN